MKSKKRKNKTSTTRTKNDQNVPKWDRRKQQRINLFGKYDFEGLMRLIIRKKYKVAKERRISDTQPQNSHIHIASFRCPIGIVERAHILPVRMIFCDRKQPRSRHSNSFFLSRSVRFRTQATKKNTRDRLSLVYLREHFKFIEYSFVRSFFFVQL